MAKGCEYLEKHITLTRNNRNFDYQVSLYPHEFAVLVNQVKHYQLALGDYKKHPSKSELPYRTVMYKKLLKDGSFKRADEGLDYMTHQFNSFKKEDVGIALIARLKSKRLPLKVLKPIHDTILIDFLYKRLNASKRVKDTFLSTSTLAEDTKLANKAEDLNHKVYRGHAVSVIDRMLELSLQEQWGGVFRVTGDNPFTDVHLIDTMVEMFVEHDLDYVRVNNVPFGVSAELFSTKYLWDLYLTMDNPMHSEYLTLFILQDENAKKGCIDIESEVNDLKYINLSVDYQADYDRALSLAAKFPNKDLYALSFKDLVSEIDTLDREDKNKMIKLPEGEAIKFSEFLGQLSSMNYVIRKKISV